MVGWGGGAVGWWSRPSLGFSFIQAEQLASGPFISEKKIVRIIGFMVFKSTSWKAPRKSSEVTLHLTECGPLVVTILHLSAAPYHLGGGGKKGWPRCYCDTLGAALLAVSECPNHG